MVRSRGKPKEIEENANTTEEKQQEEQQEVEQEAPEEQPPPTKQWEFSEKRKASLVKARAKAKELREQLKIANPPTPKEKKPTKLEHQLAQLNAIKVEPVAVVEPAAAVDPKAQDVHSETGLRHLVNHEVTSGAKASIVRKGKLVHLVD